MNVVISKVWVVVWWCNNGLLCSSCLYELSSVLYDSVCGGMKVGIMCGRKIVNMVIVIVDVL